METPIVETEAIETVGDNYVIDQYASLKIKVNTDSPLTKEDFYIVRFSNLPFTNNDHNMKFHNNKITYDNPNTVSGDISICKNLQLIVLYPGNIEIPNLGALITIEKTIWKNPDHSLISDRNVNPVTGVAN